MSAKRTLAEIAPLLGGDLLLDYSSSSGFFEDADLASARRRDHAGARDLGVALGLETITQAIANRLKTRKGELAPLGHPDYGSRHHELMGQPNVERTRDLIKLYVLQALGNERRIAKVESVTVTAEHTPPRDTVRIDITVRIIDAPAPLNLVIPFSLGF